MKQIKIPIHLKEGVFVPIEFWKYEDEHLNCHRKNRMIDSAVYDNVYTEDHEYLIMNGFELITTEVIES